MVEQLNVLGALPDDLRLVPNSCNSTSGALTPSSGLHSPCHTSFSLLFSPIPDLSLPAKASGLLRPDLLTFYFSVVCSMAKLPQCGAMTPTSMFLVAYGTFMWYVKLLRKCDACRSPCH